MPLPMVHLSVAHLLIRDHGYPASPAFYLGSIAPDAIHARPGTESRDKRRVHLVGEGGLVDPGRDEGVVDVGERHQSPRDGDVLAGQVVFRCIPVEADHPQVGGAA